MSHCLNPHCPQPQNPDRAKFCQTCGAKLLLGDRYLALKVIGQGGFGRTFLAVDVADAAKPRCVIKQLLPRDRTPAQVERAAELFEQEVERLAELGQHPQIPKLLAHFQLHSSDGRYNQYLVQEFIDGQNLEEVLAQQGPCSESQVRAILTELLPVLRFIHGYQVIHRDVKPENIIQLYDRSDSEKRLVLVDFGASKYATGTALAKTGTVIGSAGYVAPEQAIGKAEFASDLYSLGVTCIHLLTGIHPFDLYSVSEDQWIWREYLTQPISENFGQVLDKLLQRATSQRYRTATAVLQDLAVESTALVKIGAQAALATEAWPGSLVAAAPFSAALTSLGSVNLETPWHCIHTLTGHEGAVTAVAVSPDGFTLASGSTDKSVRLWSLATGELLHTFAGRSLWFGAGHRDRVNALSFSPDGQILVSASDDNTLKYWYLDQKQHLRTLEGNGWVVTTVTLSPDGQVLISGSGNGAVHLWNFTTGESIAALSGHRDRLSTVLLSPDGHTLVSGSYDKTMRQWDLRSGQLLNTLFGHNGEVSAVAITPDGKWLISGSWDCNLKIWQMSSGKQIRTLAAHRGKINSVAMHPAGQVVASGSDDSRIKLWELPTGERPVRKNYRLSTLSHSWAVNTVAFSPDGQTLVSGSADETIKVWQQHL